MGHAADNRRKFERFEINAPATLEVNGQDNRTLQLHTKDISAGGAYFQSAEPLDQGVKVTAEIIIPNETITNLTGTEFQLKVHGTVVRTDDGGMAVRFLGQEIMPVGSMMDN